jgi:hypothetical protein
MDHRAIADWRQKLAKWLTRPDSARLALAPVFEAGARPGFEQSRLAAGSSISEHDRRLMRP